MIILEPETFDIQNNSKVILTVKKGKQKLYSRNIN